ncbi:MAG: protein kinase [Acidobacteria bacterium]|nr:protein kinase [Acidobacteriota bacterium]
MSTENFFILSPGAILDGQYRIEKVLGKGGMGVVYLARHTLLDDLVAIKLVLPHLATEQYIHRFLREGKVARQISHPNIIAIHDLRITTEGIIYMVMEYFDGYTLAKELEKRGKFSPAQAIEILEPIASALEVAHAKGIIHRDLHPSNVMVKEIGQGKYQVKLLDLGLAKIRTTMDSEENKATQLTMVGQILGTPYYMSPEQWLPKSFSDDTNIDARSDIYSLATVIYELVSGQKPFSGKTIEYLSYQHTYLTPTALHELDANIPKKFSDAIAKAMSKEAQNRQQSIATLFSQLKNSLSTLNSPIVSTPPPSIPPIDIEELETQHFSGLSRGSITGDSTAKYSDLLGDKKLIIKHLSGSKAGQEERFPLGAFQELTFGREPSNTIAYDPYKDDIVARQQAKLVKDFRDPLQFVIVDNNSRNGTFVNSQRITGTIKVKAGDTIRFGSNGPEFQIDVEPKTIPPTRIPEIPGTRVSGALPLTKAATDLLNATLTERLMIKHLSGSKTGLIDYFPARDAQEITIGRDPLSLIKYDSLKDDLVSTKHAKICPEPGLNMRFIIIDLNSRNGTFVNKQRVINRMPIKFGDKIQLGANGPEFEFNIG